MEFRAASLKEREEFYKNEFDAEKLNMSFNPQFYAVDLGSKTGISKFPDKKDGLIILPPNLSPEQLKQKLIHYLPESVYYDRNIYADAEKFFKGGKFKKFWEDDNYRGQQLCFDVDAENIGDAKCGDEKCYTDIVKEAAKKALEVASILRKEYGFKDITFVYSGRGFHVKVSGRETETLSFKERSAINDTLKGMPIDRWVSGGYSKLMRLPLSLHGVVSRVATELREDELESFDPSADERVLPGFLK
jgi:DNA primase catalytic subunit